MSERRGEAERLGHQRIKQKKDKLIMSSKKEKQSHYLPLVL